MVRARLILALVHVNYYGDLKRLIIIIANLHSNNYVQAHFTGWLEIECADKRLHQHGYMTLIVGRMTSNAKLFFQSPCQSEH